MVKMNFYTGSVGDKAEDAANPGWIMGGVLTGGSY